MEPLDWIVDEVTTTLGGKPGTHSWEVVTACFGWMACVCLVIALALQIAGYTSFAGYGTSGFSFFVWIALKRDWKRLRRTTARGRASLGKPPPSSS